MLPGAFRFVDFAPCGGWLRRTRQVAEIITITRSTALGLIADIERIKRMNRSAYATDLRASAVQPVLDSAFKFKALTAATTADSMIAKGF
jgi:hypothetical protein